ncbi:MAG: AMP-binding protein, partial [Candidatus Eremiobacteraeota bacterium]|nr:AMP-binding protein [Candidatus Eremiobacteraeota bacterium]
MRAVESGPWCEHYDAGVVPELDVPDQSLSQRLLATAERWPRRAAVWSPRGWLSYQQLLSETQKFAAVLAGLGVRSGDRVLLMLPNSAQFVVAYYGVLWRGAIAVVARLDSEPDELRRQLTDCAPSLAVLARPLPPGLDEAVRQTGPDHLILASGREYSRSLRRWWRRAMATVLSRRRTRKVLRWGSLMREASDGFPFEPVPPEAPAAVLYTGGTTGPPRGVVLSHRSLMANSRQLAAWDPKMGRRHERVLVALPLSHSYGLSAALGLSVEVGGTLILTQSQDPEVILDLASRFKPTLFPGIPALYAALLRRPNLRSYRLHSIRACISGAAPLPVELQEGFEKVTKGRLVEGYGLTEAGPVTHANPIYGRRRAGSIGLPLPGTCAKVVGLDTGQEVGPGRVGELWVRGPQLMTGYWNDQSTSSEVLVDGWLRTGDLAQMDSDGYFFLINRISDVIELPERRIFPRDVEEILFEHPALMDAAAAGAPRDDPQEVVAFAVPAPGRSVTEQELL